MKISTIDQLLSALYACEQKSDFVQVANNMAADKIDFSRYQHFSPKHYTRNCIERTDAFELILLCWEEGQVTPIHCHGGKECWVQIVEGQMVEDRYDYNSQNALEKVETTNCRNSDVTFMNDDLGYHTLSNVNNGRSMSLHLYASPIKECRIFNSKTNEFEWRKMRDYSYKGELLAHHQI